MRAISLLLFFLSTFLLAALRSDTLTVLIDLEIPKAGATSPERTVTLSWRDPTQAFSPDASYSFRVPTGRRSKLVFRLPVRDAVGIRLAPCNCGAPVILRELTFSAGLSWRSFSTVGDLAAVTLSEATLRESTEGFVVETVDHRGYLEFSPFYPTRFDLVVCALTAGILAIIFFLRFDLLQAAAHQWNGFLSSKTLDRLSERLNHPLLIPVTPPLLVIVFLVGGLGIVASFLGIHASSIGMWDLFLHRNNPNATLLGMVRAIRSDEWLVWTPNLISQALTEDPGGTNFSVGFGASPLLTSLPADHPITLLRPQLWGFFFLPLENAFALFWQLKMAGFFLSSLLAILLVTRTLWVSVIGAAWMYYSAYTQWWFSSMLPEMVSWGWVAMISAAYLLVARSRFGIVVAAGVLFISGINFALFFYPPFQIPLGYLFVALLGGVVLRSGISPIRAHGKLRMFLFMAVGMLTTAVGFLFITETSTTLTTLMSTAYPGRRESTGGGISIRTLFEGAYSAAYSENWLPVAVGNVCEGSGFVLLWPCALLGLMANRERRAAWRDFAPLTCLLIAGTTWCAVGTWPGLERALLLNHVPPTRAILALGVGSIILCAIAIKEIRYADPVRKLWVDCVALGFVLAFAYRFGMISSSRITQLFEPIDRFLVSATILSAGAALLYRSRLVVLFVALIALVCGTGFTVNPLARGLDPVLKSDLVQEAATIVKHDPLALWIGEGNRIPNLLKISGARVFNGVKYLPHLESLEKFDPDHQSVEVYNRYAHITYIPEVEDEKTDLALIAPDAFSMTSNPCTAAWEKAQLKYLVLRGAQYHKDFNCLRRLHRRPLDGEYFIYRREPVATGP